MKASVTVELRLSIKTKLTERGTMRTEIVEKVGVFPVGVKQITKVGAGGQ